LAGKEARMNYLRLEEMFFETIVKVIGSWLFIFVQCFLFFAWILLNRSNEYVFDPYAYTLLNLILSLQTVCTGSILLMTIRRQTVLDRSRDIEYLRIQKRIHETVLMLNAHKAHINLIEFAKTDKSSKV
jgi:uncharacterized membrane protein